MSQIFKNLGLIPLEWWVVFGGAVACAWGSFFNVVIWRMPRGESVIHPPSQCPQCGSGIAWYDNIPVLGWICLRGKCRNCKNPISMEYPLVEALTGCVGAGMLYSVSLFIPSATWADYLMAYTMGLILIPVIIIDLRHFLIPDMMVLPGALIAWVLADFRVNFDIFDSLMGGFGIALGLWAFATLLSWVLKKQAMGFGDVKFMLFAGSILGFQDALLAVVLSSFIGLIIIPFLTLMGSHQGGKKFPYGPMLGIATFMSFYWSEKIWSWYFEFVGLS